MLNLVLLEAREELKQKIKARKKKDQFAVVFYLEDPETSSSFSVCFLMVDLPNKSTSIHTQMLFSLTLFSLT